MSNTNIFDFDVGIIGGGIIGLATAKEIVERNALKNGSRQRFKVVVFEKEDAIAKHQSTNNSGVIHAGIYYTPKSKRATLCVQGAKMMYEYCEKKKIPYQRCGKLIAAVTHDELPRLEALYRRGVENGIEGLRMIDKDEIKRYEPNLEAIRAIYSPNSGITDYSLVSKSYAQDFESLGGQIKLQFAASDFEKHGLSDNNSNTPGIKIISSNGEIVTTRYLIVCAGLYSDRIALKTGGKLEPKIVPIRGEWRVLKRENSDLVKSLIYPVPDPRYPWLGVHFTKKINGEVWIGPNAVLASAREGYRYQDVNMTDLADAFSYKGFRKLVINNIPTGISELYRSLFVKPHVKELQQYMPSITTNHLSDQKRSGVRAQALDSNGNLVQDFVFDISPSWKSILHVRNAPSPAATSSLAIAREIVNMVEKNFTLD